MQIITMDEDRVTTANSITEDDGALLSLRS